MPCSTHMCSANFLTDIILFSGHLLCTNTVVIIVAYMYDVHVQQWKLFYQG